MTEGEFYRIYQLMKNKYGIDLERKREIVSGRLENYFKNGSWSSYTQYLNEVENDATGELEMELVNILTTNHTFFMREAEHFDFLRRVVLPELKKKESRRKDLCIWCGAASTGEEPYTLAMYVMDFFGFEHEQWDTKILATDISTDVLQHAMKGIYTADQIENVPPNWQRRFFKPDFKKENYEVRQELRDEVIFRKFNLMDIFPFKRKMHVIFLRNVMIYFDKETKRELLEKVYDVLEPGGYLFIGRTETIDRSDIPFRLVQPSIFRK